VEHKNTEQQQQQQQRRQMEDEQQQHHFHQLHRSVREGISKLSDPRYRKQSHELSTWTSGRATDSELLVNRYSFQYLVDFLDSQQGRVTFWQPTAVTKLKLNRIRLPHPSDGGLQVLHAFFSRSDTTLTNVELYDCDFGSQEDTIQLLAAFHPNRTVTGLTVGRIRHMDGVTLGNSFAGLLQNMPRLQRLELLPEGIVNNFGVDGVRAMQKSLQANRTLKSLRLAECSLGDEGIHIIADALVGNTIIESLDVSYNNRTSKGLAAITRLVESTQLQGIGFSNYFQEFCDTDLTQHFITALQHRNSSLQALPELIPQLFPKKTFGHRAATYYSSIQDSLTRNRQLHRVNNILLAPSPPPPPRQQQPGTSNTTLLLKISHKAITSKFAAIPNNAGASAIFKLFTARPQLLAKRIKRPPPAVAVADDDDDEQKRRRLQDSS
jgi:Leucine Rich repeat